MDRHVPSRTNEMVAKLVMCKTLCKTSVSHCHGHISKVSGWQSKSYILRANWRYVKLQIHLSVETEAEKEVLHKVLHTTNLVTILLVPDGMYTAWNSHENHNFTFLLEFFCGS